MSIDDLKSDDVFPEHSKIILQEIDKLIRQMNRMIADHDNFKYNDPFTPEQKYLRDNVERLHLMRRYQIIGCIGNMEDHQRLLKHVFAKLFQMSNENDRLATELYELKNKGFGK